MKVLHTCLSSFSNFIVSSFVSESNSHTIMKMAGNVHGFFPKVIEKNFGMKHESIYFLKYYILTFKNPILLTGDGGGELIKYTFRRIKFRETRFFKFPSTIAIDFNNLTNFYPLSCYKCWHRLSKFIKVLYFIKGSQPNCTLRSY